MASEAPRPADELEGIILRDGGGGFYEVPAAVIARYRVLANEILPAEVAGHMLPVRSLSEGEWTVYGAVYTRRSDARPLE